MTDAPDTTIPGIAVVIDEKAVRVTSALPLAVLSSAVVGGGLCSARDIVNMHVDKDYDGGSPEDDLAAFAASCGVGSPFVGLMTAASTEHACVVAESRDGATVAAVVSLGLSNTSNAGVTPPLTGSPGTINAILLIDAALTPSAMVNAVITATEAKTMTLSEWDVRTPQGDPASGTSTDAVVVACTGQGTGLSYAGPATTVGWLVARTVRAAITRLCREKVTRDGGRRVGW
ncbi:MAG: adenosylcobinamide amidohydrolase [Actinobacteria bacterium]|nr:adenosylcobinamide amidohydrolase [Actinomycetota bacterium]